MNAQTPATALVIEHQAEAREVTPLTLLDRALTAGADPATLREFMELQREFRRDQAKMAFSEAFAGFKSEAIKIVRNRKVEDGPLKGRRYAELSSFVEAAVPLLSKHGLSHSWAITRDDKDWIEVTCTIEHVLGGTKTASAGGPPDGGGAKNPLQARISTITYLERVTLKAAAGLSESGDDDDGRASGDPGTISDEQIADLRGLIVRAAPDLPKFLENFGIEDLADLPVLRLSEAKMVLNMKIKADEKKARAKDEAA